MPLFCAHPFVSDHVFFLLVVNRRIREHGRDAWSSIAVRHKAEQIDWLYWNETEGDDAVGDYGASALALHQEDDLSLDKYV